MSKRSGNEFRDYGCLLILFIINLINFMDRFAIAGVLTQVQAFFSIDDSQAGLLQSVFTIFYMTFAPLFGFLGDRYNRKWIITVGIALWTIAVLASTYVPARLFWLFLLLRGIGGIGAASFPTIAPTMIADMFAVPIRSRALMLFYFAIPVGSGLGYVTSSNISMLMGGWQCGIRSTPIMGASFIAFIILAFKEPTRGKAEEFASPVRFTDIQKTTYLQDIKAIFQIPTYISATIAYTSVIFTIGTLSWWSPTAIEYSTAMREHLNSTNQLTSDQKNRIALNFGAITVVGGILGILAGSLLSQFWSQGKWCFRPIQTARAKPLVCGIGSILGIPFLSGGLHLITTETKLAWMFFFLTIMALCMNWAINVDMLLDVIVPHRRSIANSWQIFISHLFGDASGPYVIGLISDWARGSDNNPTVNFMSLRNALYTLNIVLIISATLFFVAATNVVKDHDKFQQQMGYPTSSNYGSAVYNGKDVRLGNSAVNRAFQQ